MTEHGQDFPAGGVEFAFAEAVTAGAFLMQDGANGQVGVGLDVRLVPGPIQPNQRRKPARFFL